MSKRIIFILFCHALSLGASLPEANVPVLDFSKWRGDTESKNEIAHELKAAMSGSGFIYVENHGVSEGIKSKCYDDVQTFMDRPIDEKKEFETSSVNGWQGVNATLLYGEPGYHESCMYCGQGLSDMAKDHSSMTSLENCFEFSTLMKEFSNEMLRLYSYSLGIDEDFFVSKHTWNGREQDCFRMNYYPAIPEDLENPPRFGAHSDWSTISVLTQNAEGLEIWNRFTKRWELAAPKENTFVVNTGTIMQFYTNDLYPSTFHRVRVQSEGRHKERISIAYFSNIQDDALVDARDVFPNDEPKRGPINGGEYVKRREQVMLSGTLEESINSEVESLGDELEALEAHVNDAIFKTEL